LCGIGAAADRRADRHDGLAGGRGGVGRRTAQLGKAQAATAANDHANTYSDTDCDSDTDRDADDRVLLVAGQPARQPRDDLVCLRDDRELHLPV